MSPFYWTVNEKTGTSKPVFSMGLGSSKESKSIYFHLKP
nr:MAG TPA: hypothetical protein [Caudoviricetes sp.]